MALRSDISVNFFVSPRIITVASPSTTLTIQDLYDTLRSIEATLPSTLQFDSLLKASGKDSLGSGTSVGITLTLQNSLLAFAARIGPSYVQCIVSGGNLLGADSNGNIVSPISPTAFTQVVISQSTSAALIAGAAGATWDELLSAHTIAGSMGAAVQESIALSMKNAKLTGLTWDTFGNMLTGTLKCYSSRAALDAEDPAGLLYTYNLMSSTDVNGKNLWTKQGA